MCFGTAALHLYFLPTLLAGTTLAFVLAPWFQRLERLWWLNLLGVAAFLPVAGIVHQATVQPLVEPLPVNLAIRVGALFADTLPYLLLALGSQGFAKKYASSPAAPRCGLLLLAAGFLLALDHAFPVVPVPEHILTPLCGGLVFLGAFFLSRTFPAWPWLSQLGRAVFGIYLVHHLLIEAVEFAVHRSHSAWLEVYHWPQIVVMTTVVFLASAALTLGFHRLLGSRVRPPADASTKPKSR